jgi:hypothetical protein
MTNNERRLRDALLCVIYALVILKNQAKFEDETLIEELHHEIQSIKAKLEKLE